MVLVAELDQVAQVGWTALDPVCDVMDVGELGVTTPWETAALVAPADLEALRVTGVAAGASEVEAPTVGPVGRDEDLGVARQATGHFTRDGTERVELPTASAFAAGQEGHVRVHDQRRTVAPPPAA